MRSAGSIEPVAAVPSASRREGRPPRRGGRLSAWRRARPASCVLNSMTSGWSISNTVVPAGHGSRYARESRPDARITACRMPARASLVHEEFVEELGADGHVLGHPPHADRRAVARGLGSISPSSPVKKSMPTARTNGSANGSLINGSRPCSPSPAPRRPSSPSPRRWMPDPRCRCQYVPSRAPVESLLSGYNEMIRPYVPDLGSRCESLGCRATDLQLLLS